MGIDHITDRHRCAHSDGHAQRTALCEAAAAVNHGNAALSNDKADVGDRAEIFLRHPLLVHTLMHEHAGGHFVHLQGIACSKSRNGIYSSQYDGKAHIAHDAPGGALHEQTGAPLPLFFHMRLISG